jgi:hypothetical protein
MLRVQQMTVLNMPYKSSSEESYNTNSLICTEERGSYFLHRIQAGFGTKQFPTGDNFPRDKAAES